MEKGTILILTVLLALWFLQELIRTRVAKKDMREYYKSPLWQQKREEAFRVLGRKCAVCGTHENLQVHHLRYRRWLVPIFGKENPKKDLMILCKEHHIKGRYSRSQIRARRLFYKLFGF